MKICKNSVKHRERKYKQMSLEVAVRNVERYGAILKFLSRFENQILDDETILNMYAGMYFEKIISDTNDSFDNKSFDEVKEFVKEKKHHNNEWGFPTGYQAAFNRYLKTLSEFGFIYSQYDQTLILSEIAHAVCDDKITLNDAFSLQSFRFWRKSPYRRVLNDFNFFTFIYKTLVALKDKNRRLTYPEFLVGLFSDDGNVEKFINTIETEKFGSNYQKAYDYIFKHYSKIDSMHDKVAKIETSFNDYGNTVFRVFQFTGFLNVDYSSGIMLLSLNENRAELLNQLINKNFSLTEEEKENEYDYFIKIGNFDKNLQKIIFDFNKQAEDSTKDYTNKIPEILKKYNLGKKTIKGDLINLCNNKKDSGSFWYLDAPLKFEFLLVLFIFTCYDRKFNYKPNFKCDEFGIPYSHAPGNIGDIEIYDDGNYWLVEATLIKNKNQQINNETLNLIRHINKNFNGNKYLQLVAPYIHTDTDLMLRTSNLISLIEINNLNFYSKASDINEFIDMTERQDNFSQIYNFTKKQFKEVYDILKKFNY